MIEKISFFTGQNDEQANIELAYELIGSEDAEGIKEIVDRLSHKNSSVANDCIKVLYEIGNKRPELIAEYVDIFIRLIRSKNNRLVWGAMTALSEIAHLKSETIMGNLDQVITAYREGSVITIDNSISVFAQLVQSGLEGSQKVYDLLIEHLATCRPKEVAQHSERTFVCINETNSKKYKEVLEGRLEDLSESQTKRVQKVLKKIERHEFYQ